MNIATGATVIPLPRYRVAAITTIVEVCYLCRGAGWLEDGQVSAIGRGHICAVCGGAGKIVTEAQS